MTMRAKLQNRPFDADHGQLAENARSNRSQPVLDCIRQVQSSAEQICNNAEDIVEARFLARSIVDACRRVLSNGTGTLPIPPRVNGARAESAILAVATAAGKPDASTAAAAEEKLGRLSAREFEIFTHLAEGYSAAEIAVTLCRSTKTINNHRTRILQKLGLNNATELVRLAIRSGLISV
jgi:DNA-binding NarL/FixJ family response regulator